MAITDPRMLSGLCFNKLTGEIRELGPRAVEVKDHIVPLIEERPALSLGEQYGAATIADQGSRAVRTWPVRTVAEIAEDNHEEAVAALTLVGFRMLLNHENRVRALEARQAVTAEQFREGLKDLVRGAAASDP